MDNDVKKLILVAATAAVIIAVARPKNLFKAKSKSRNLSQPKTADISDKDFENSIVAIKAMRAAITDKMDNTSLDELNKQIVADYNLKVSIDDSTGKLYTKNSAGTVVARES